MCPHYDFPNVSYLRRTPDDLQKWTGKIPQYLTLHKELKASCGKLLEKWFSQGKTQPIGVQY